METISKTKSKCDDTEKQPGGCGGNKRIGEDIMGH